MRIIQVYVLALELDCERYSSRRDEAVMQFSGEINGAGPSL
jgi:hypothetical protein